MTTQVDLTKVSQRAKLLPRGNPYYMRLETGFFIGLRVSKSAESWVARRYCPQRQTNVTHSLGSFKDLPQAERYAAARTAAQEWFAQGAASAPRHSRTVSMAAAEYAEANPQQLHLERDVKRLIDADPIGGVRLGQLAPKQVETWVKRRTDLVRGNGKPAAISTLNREMTTLRSVLNYALAQKWVASDEPWKLALKPQKTSGGRREVYIAPQCRLALCDALPAEAKAFFTALRLTGLRPGALAALTVADYNPATRELTIPQDKAGAGRTFTLGKTAAAHFNAACKNKLPAAPLFANATGGHFDRFQWRDPLREAIAKLELDPRICAYSFRHSAITDMLTRGVDVLTVAKITGTSIAMIDKHYGHLVDAGSALEALA
ncbi:site-specific integrase [Qipengyuania aquimaris]|uniref:tyrosine-type recombinase/integrase n=1 Tax=Qipengyuania aquimaris TaxID=255984 RepID=UPI001C96FD6E|nr:tyrosine-type recombinase/integrase [Qipengyuania aquimaris]MBY6127853.1 site-specific integrase [Qipengyuania aquimaris]